MTKHKNTIIAVVLLLTILAVLMQVPIEKANIADRDNNSFIIDIPITEYKGDEYIDIYLAYPILKDTKLSTEVFTIDNKGQYITLDAFKSIIKYTYNNVKISSNDKIKDVIVVSNINRL